MNVLSDRSDVSFENVMSCAEELLRQTFKGIFVEDVTSVAEQGIVIIFVIKLNSVCPSLFNFDSFCQAILLRLTARGQL